MKDLFPLVRSSRPGSLDLTGDDIARFLEDSITMKLKRTGDAPLLFEGELIAEAGGRLHNGRELNRWHEIRIYQISTGYVLGIVFHTSWQGESDRYFANCYDTTGEVATALRNFEPVGNSVGYPPGKHFEERQARLEAELRSQFADSVTEVLDSEEFAERV